jgi:hypothetical protein
MRIMMFIWVRNATLDSSLQIAILKSAHSNLMKWAAENVLSQTSLNLLVLFEAAISSTQHTGLWRNHLKEPRAFI